MIDASYGDGPKLNKATRNWGYNDPHYHLLLHYNGLISGYFNFMQEHNDFVHSSIENKNHY